MRFILLALAAYHGINGAFMLIAPEIWYDTVPGASHTGAYNIHFIKDIGLAFLAAGFALGYAGWRGIVPGLLLAALVFTAGHAGLHTLEMIEHRAALDVWLRDTVLIVIPGVLPVLAFWRLLRLVGAAR